MEETKRKIHLAKLLPFTAFVYNSIDTEGDSRSSYTSLCGDRSHISSKCLFYRKKMKKKCKYAPFTMMIHGHDEKCYYFYCFNKIYVFRCGSIVWLLVSRGELDSQLNSIECKSVTNPTKTSHVTSYNQLLIFHSDLPFKSGENIKLTKDLEPH